MNMRACRGFTLTELIFVVAAITGIYGSLLSYYVTDVTVFVGSGAASFQAAEVNKVNLALVEKCESKFGADNSELSPICSSSSNKFSSQMADKIKHCDSTLLAPDAFKSCKMQARALGQNIVNINKDNNDAPSYVVNGLIPCDAAMFKCGD